MSVPPQPRNQVGMLAVLSLWKRTRRAQGVAGGRLRWPPCSPSCGPALASSTCAIAARRRSSPCQPWSSLLLLAYALRRGPVVFAAQLFADRPSASPQSRSCFFSVPGGLACGRAGLRRRVSGARTRRILDGRSSGAWSWSSSSASSERASPAVPTRTPARTYSAVPTRSLVDLTTPARRARAWTPGGAGA